MNILPCPFCGKEPNRRSSRKGKEICCMNHDCIMPSTRRFDYQNWMQAENAWNRRMKPVVKIKPPVSFVEPRGHLSPMICGPGCHMSPVRTSNFDKFFANLPGNEVQR